MDEAEGKSKVARLMRQIDLELEAARRSLHAFAITAQHDFINARMQRNGERILRLIDAGKHEEAQVLMNSDDWSSDHPHQVKHQRWAKRTKQRKSCAKQEVSEHERR